MNAAQDIRLYIKEAKSWETDRIMHLEQSRRTAWRIALAAGLIAFFAVAAIVLLTPLKQVEPFVIRVDNSTGAVDVVSKLTDGKERYSEAISKYFAQRYVRYREGYARALAEEYYRYTGLMSGAAEQRKYAEWFAIRNPDSPLNIHGDFARVTVDIKSTSFISPTVALVRYTKYIVRGQDREHLSHWAATITFRYSSSPMSAEDRSINPLGFQVMEYRNDPDAAVAERKTGTQTGTPLTAEAKQPATNSGAGQTQERRP